MKNIISLAVIAIIMLGCKEVVTGDNLNGNSGINNTAGKIDKNLDITYKKMHGEFSREVVKDYEIVDFTVLDTVNFINGLPQDTELSERIDSYREWKVENNKINITYPDGLVKGSNDNLITYNSMQISGLKHDTTYKIEVEIELEGGRFETDYSNPLSINYNWQRPVYNSQENVYVYSYGLVNENRDTLNIEFQQFLLNNESLIGTNAYITDFIIEEIEVKNNHLLSGNYSDESVTIFWDDENEFSAHYHVSDDGETLTGILTNSLNETIGNFEAQWDNTFFIGSLNFIYESIEYTQDVSAVFNLDNLDVLIEVVGNSNYWVVNRAQHELSQSERFEFTDSGLIDFNALVKSNSIEPFIELQSYSNLILEPEIQIINNTQVLNLFSDLESDYFEKYNSISSNVEFFINEKNDKDYVKVELDLNYSSDFEITGYNCNSIRIEIFGIDSERNQSEQECLKNNDITYGFEFDNLSNIDRLKVLPYASADREDLNLSVLLNSIEISNYNVTGHLLKGGWDLTLECNDSSKEYIASWNIDNDGNIQNTDLINRYGVQEGIVDTTLINNRLILNLEIEELNSFNFEVDYSQDAFGPKEIIGTENGVTCTGNIRPLF